MIPPEQHLWVAVIARAMFDALGNDEYLADQAAAWIDTPDFLTVCDLAEFDPTRARRLAKAKLQRRIRRPRPKKWYQLPAGWPVPPLHDQVARESPPAMDQAPTRYGLDS